METRCRLRSGYDPIKIQGVLIVCLNVVQFKVYVDEIQLLAVYRC